MIVHTVHYDILGLGDPLSFFNYSEEVACYKELQLIKIKCKSANQEQSYIVALVIELQLTDNFKLIRINQNSLKAHCPTCSYLLPLYRKLPKLVPVGPP